MNTTPPKPSGLFLVEPFASEAKRRAAMAVFHRNSHLISKAIDQIGCPEDERESFFLAGVKSLVRTVTEYGTQDHAQFVELAKEDLRVSMLRFKNSLTETGQQSTPSEPRYPNGLGLVRKNDERDLA